MSKQPRRVGDWIGRNWVLLILVVLALLLLILTGFRLLDVTEVLIAYSSVTIVVFTAVLVDLTREANIFALWSQKHALDPDLRVSVRKRWRLVTRFQVSEDADVEGEQKPRFFEQWQAELLLWNTGSGTILVKGWSVRKEEDMEKRRVWLLPDRDAAVPPILIPALGSVSLEFWVTCEAKATLAFEYATADSESRYEEVEIGSC